MRFDYTAIGAGKEILHRKLGGEFYQPVTITQFNDGVCLAGSPIGADGTIQNNGNAIGILLNNVFEGNPNGTLVRGFAAINVNNARENSGVELAETVREALHHLMFEDSNTNDR